MNELEEELQYEKKMDRIAEQIEDLVLDAMLAALHKIKQRKLILSACSHNVKDDSMQF